MAAEPDTTVDELFAQSDINITAPVSHRTSVGLIKWNVQMIMGRIRRRGFSVGSTGGWGLNVRDAQARTQEVTTTTTSRPPRSKPGDLVLLRDLQPDKQHGKKLTPRWFVPRIVVSLSSSGVSCNVRQIHDPPTATKRYHIDDLAAYVPPEPLSAHPAAGGTVTYSRDVFGAPVAFVEGQRPCC